MGRHISKKDVRRTTAYNSVTKLFYFEDKETYWFSYPEKTVIKAVKMSLIPFLIDNLE